MLYTKFMDQHPVPRQISTFEFKLIGFLTLRQFIFIALFSALGVVFFYGIPVPVLNIAATVIAVVAGLALSFIRINERPFDLFVRNFIKKLFSPSQYYYVKKNSPPPFLTEINQSENTAKTYVLARQKLTTYLNQKNQSLPYDQKKQQIDRLLANKTALPKSSTVKPSDQANDKPFLAGVVKNSKNIPLPGILVYIKNQNQQLVRILKSNPHGLFATFHPLDQGEYEVDAQDPDQSYFFDTMKIKIADSDRRPLTIVSKELL